MGNLQGLIKITLSRKQALELFLAVPGRRYSDLTEMLQAIKAKAGQATQEIIEEVRWSARDWG